MQTEDYLQATCKSLLAQDKSRRHAVAMAAHKMHQDVDSAAIGGDTHICADMSLAEIEAIADKACP